MCCACDLFFKSNKKTNIIHSFLKYAVAEMHLWSLLVNRALHAIIWAMSERRWDVYTGSHPVQMLLLIWGQAQEDWLIYTVILSSTTFIKGRTLQERMQDCYRCKSQYICISKCFFLVVLNFWKQRYDSSILVIWMSKIICISKYTIF